MTNNSTLSSQVAVILDALCFLPGRRGISVQSRRYPRLLAAESGLGFEQRNWSFDGERAPSEVTIPSDAEEVRVTWVGKSSAQTQIHASLTAAMTGMLPSSSHWDFQIFTRRNGPNDSDLIVEVFQNFL